MRLDCLADLIPPSLEILSLKAMPGRNELDEALDAFINVDGDLTHFAVRPSFHLLASFFSLLLLTLAADPHCRLVRRRQYVPLPLDLFLFFQAPFYPSFLLPTHPIHLPSYS